MAWSETKPSHWQRPLGPNESMIKMIGDGGHTLGQDVWSISATAHFTAHLESKPLTQALRDGWTALRFHHPSVAATATDDNLHYIVPGTEDLARWENETFIVVEGESSVDHVIAALGPRRYATCYYLEKHDTLLLYLSHWRTDGIGALYLLDALLGATIEVLHENPLDWFWGQEISRFAPSVEEALGLPDVPTEAIERAAKPYLATLGHNIGALGIPVQLGEGDLPNGTRVADFCFSEEQTTKMLSACSRLGIRLESALHAAIAATAYSIAEPASIQKHHSSTMRHSIRPHLPPPYDSVAGAAGLYTAGYIVKVPASQSWLENARYYDSEYGKGATPELLQSRRQYALTMKDILRNMKPPNPPPSGLDMSWVPGAQDLVATKHSNGGQFLEVQKIGIGIQVLSRHAYVFGWIFRDQLELRLVCNQAFYSNVFAEKVLELVRQHLVANLLA
ncbi:hypothetical protein GGS24DRAFT_121638 [Hypoxylon argillaceum]|nr:hypothetical protein GGS24DRAFT_121638 [Hypoxylon argillaceum]